MKAISKQGSYPSPMQNIANIIFSLEAIAIIMRPFLASCASEHYLSSKTHAIDKASKEYSAQHNGHNHSWAPKNITKPWKIKNPVNDFMQREYVGEVFLGIGAYLSKYKPAYLGDETLFK